MTDAAGFSNKDDIPSSTPAGNVGTTTALPIVLTAFVASAKIDDTAETRGAPVMLAPIPVACENNWERTGCKDAWALLGRSEAADNKDEMSWSGSTVTEGKVTAFAALVASPRIVEMAIIRLGSIAEPEAAAPEICEIMEAISGCADVWISPGSCVASERRLDIAWRGLIVTEGIALTPPAASVAALRIDDIPEIKVGSTTPVAAFGTWATREAIGGCIEVWISLGNRVAADKSSETAWIGSAVLISPAALVASASANERLETKPESTTPVAAAMLTCETKEAMTGWIEVWISPGSWVASESKLVIACRGSTVTAGVESESPAAEVASERTWERLDTRPGSTTPVEAPALIWDIKEETSGCTELWISVGSWVAWPSSVETACRGSTVRAGVDNASPAASVPSARIDESPFTKVGSMEPVAVAAVAWEIRDEMEGASEVWMSLGSWAPCESKEEMTWTGSAVMNAVGSIDPSPGRPVATFKMEEMAFVTWGSTVPVAEAAKPKATESREDRGGLTLLCTSPGKLDTPDKRDEIIEIGSAVTGLGKRGVSSGIPVTSTRMEESAKLAPKSPTVADASISVATDNNEERGGCTLLTTLAGKLETAENKDESASTGSAVKGFEIREASSGMPVTSTRTEDMAEVATGSITLLAAFEASPKRDDSMGAAVAWTSAGRLDASASKEEIMETGSNVAGFVTSGRRVVSLPRTWVLGAGNNSVSPARIWVDGAGSRLMRPPRTWVVGVGKSVVKSPRIWVLRSGSSEVSPPSAWVSGGGNIEVRAPRTLLVCTGISIVAPKLALRFGSSKSDETAETASWGISVCRGLLISDERRAMAVGTESTPCELTSERTEDIAGKNEAAVGDCISDDKIALADVGRALWASKEEMIDTAFSGASVAWGTCIKDDKVDIASAASPETWFPRADTIEEIAGRTFDWLGAASKDDNAILAELGRAPPSINEDIDGKASWGTPVWVGIWIKELKTETAEVKAPVARLPTTDSAEFTPGRIEVSTGTASKVVEGIRETWEASCTTEDTTPATEDASPVLLTAIS
jgi:hypothetical protein